MKLNSPTRLLTAFLLALPAVVSPDVYLRLFLFLYITAVTVAERRRILILPSAVMFAGIVILNLLTPIGRVLFTFISFPVTMNALLLGISKASFFLYFIYLSKFALAGKISGPGLAAETLYYFGLMLSIDKKDFLRRPVEFLDGIFVRFAGKCVTAREESGTRERKINIPFLAAMNIIPWGLFILRSGQIRLS